MFGTITIRIISASCQDLLTALSKKGFILSDVNMIDLLTMTAVVNRRDFPQIKKELDRLGAKNEVVNKGGVYWTVVSLLHRPVLITGVLLIIFLILFLPTRILFFSVTGNNQVSSMQVLENAAGCGIKFGASRAAIRNEKVKNRLLEQMPKLQWVGVNTYGCCVVISVEEKGENTDEKPIGNNIVAAQDGVILDITATKGIPMYSVGQAVKKGQVLISGYVDYGLLVKSTGAEGEATALTKHQITAKKLTNYTRKGAIQEEKTRWSILLGKKLINLYKDSGISPANCDRMYLEYNLRLPGGFQLPVGIAIERIVYYDEVTVPSTEKADCHWMQESVDEHLLSNLLGGEIIHRQVAIKHQDGVCILHATYQCKEIISRIRYEEIMQQHE